MLGRILQLTLSFSALFLFITLFWQCPIADAVPVLATDDNMDKSNDDASRLLYSSSHTGAIIKKRFLHTTVNQPWLIDGPPIFSPPRYLKSTFPLSKKNSSPNLFQSTGTYNKNLRAAKRMKAALDNRLKRFRMLDQDEFQEMLKSLSQQTVEDQSKTSNGMDAIGGMQLANYWSSV
ncbi:unnamed protein product [Adineta ricciae]|uniref:Uncharacterized protein n=1 Tax=Adineta ricciae TaxID=249248 RepID=A0A814BUP8_ADIRI|nr:unnamed protein product [Adineta ricciae]